MHYKIINNAENFVILNFVIIILQIYYNIFLDISPILPECIFITDFENSTIKLFTVTSRNQGCYYHFESTCGILNASRWIGIWRNWLTVQHKFIAILRPNYLLDISLCLWHNHMFHNELIKIILELKLLLSIIIDKII